MVGRPDEFRLIADLFAPLAEGYPGALGLTDDAALIAGQTGRDMVVSVDAMVAGVHFLPDDPPGLVARKLVRVNLSDLAAKGATPEAVLLAAAFPKGTDLDWLRAFADGLGADLRAFGVALAGGDTVSTPGPLTLSITALGRVEQGRALLRGAAEPGDDIWVTGTIGDGALGLLAAQGGLDIAADHMAFLADRYRLPRPRVEAGPRLIGLARAAMDVSDGLIQDLGHICAASAVGAEVDVASIPLSAAALAAVADDNSRLATVLTGGDDYELLFTASGGAQPAIAALADELGLPMTRVGRITAGEGVVAVDASGCRLAVEKGGWRHF